MGAPAARVHELSREWVRMGHQVTVLTGFPNHPTGKIDENYRSKVRKIIYEEHVDGIRVVRAPLIPLPNRSAWERMVNYSSFCLSGAICGSFLKSPDVIIATSPQLLVGLSGLWISLLKKVPLIFEVRDLWPESIVAADMGGESSTTVKILGKIAALLYRKAAHIVVVSPAFKEVLIRDWHVSPQRISVVSNGVDTNLFKPIPSDKNGQTGKFVVSYIGTLGAAHGLSTVVEAARLLSNADANVQFLIVGEGSEKVDLMQLVKSYNIENIQFISQQPRSKIPGFICESDVCLVPLKNSAIFKTVIPTKMLEFMACGRPVILGVEGQAKEILEKANAGLAVAPENPEHLVKAIERLRSDENLRDSLGNNGVEYVFNNFSRESTSVSYLELLENILSCKIV